MTQNLCGSKRATRGEPTKQTEVSAESRALARQLADGADGSAAAGRLFKRLIRDLSAAVDAEIKEAHRVWFATDPDQRQFLLSVQEPGNYGPCSVAFRELHEALKADDAGWDEGYTVTARPPVREGLRPGHAWEDWLDKYLPVVETDSEANQGAK
jgi:hypothetical protein